MFLPYFRWINNTNYFGPPHSPRPIYNIQSLVLTNILIVHYTVSSGGVGGIYKIHYTVVCLEKVRVNIYCNIIVAFQNLIFMQQFS
jgi:hypothetical protein